MRDYIDVRGPIPIYVRGQLAISLEGYDRSLTIEQARDIVRYSDPVELNEYIALQKRESID